jgi:azurin
VISGVGYDDEGRGTDRTARLKGHRQMKRVSFVLVLAAAALWAAQPMAQSAAKPAAKPAAKTAATGRLIEITAHMTPDGKYGFEPSTISAKPAEALRVRVKSAGPQMPKIAMSHNFVLLKPSTNLTTFANDAIAAGFPANFIPAGRKADILASTPLAGVGETQEVAFKAPAAGTYPFVCTFPGHMAGGMKGTLVVK